jgi:hypothetical protein
MKRTYIPVVLGLLVALVSLACGLNLGGGDNQATVVEQVQEQVVPETGVDTESVDTSAAQPPDTSAGAEEPAGETESQPGTTTDTAAGEADFEEAGIDTTQITVLDNLRSYRSEMSVTFTGTSNGEPADGTVNVQIELTRDPAAQHLVMNGEGMEFDEAQGPLRVEMYEIDNSTYVTGIGFDGWAKFPAGDSASFTESFLTLADIFDVPEQARRKVLPETVNGVPAWHYVFDRNHLAGDEAVFEEVRGDAWIAVDGGYLVKLDYFARGRSLEMGSEAPVIDEGTIQISYNLTDVNDNFAITLPEAAAAAADGGGLFGGVDSEGSSRDDIPLPDDADIQLSIEGLIQFTTGLEVSAATEFMQNRLEALGWIPAGEPLITPDAALIDYEKDGAKISIIIGPDTEGSGLTSVFISVQ